MLYLFIPCHTGYFLRWLKNNNIFLIFFLFQTIHHFFQREHLLYNWDDLSTLQIYIHVRHIVLPVIWLQVSLGYLVYLNPKCRFQILKLQMQANLSTITKKNKLNNKILMPKIIGFNVFILLLGLQIVYLTHNKDVPLKQSPGFIQLTSTAQMHLNTIE